MGATLFLEFKPLESEDLPLAFAVAGNERPDDPDSESFGLDQSPEALRHCRAWGLWIKGTLSGAVWVEDSAPGAARVRALALGRGWRCMGLFAWMLSELAAGLRAEGVREIRADISGGGYRLGEGLAEAGFVGPDTEIDSYPAGTWTHRR